MYVYIVACTNYVWQIEQFNCMHIVYWVRVKCIERLLINNITSTETDSGIEMELILSEIVSIFTCTWLCIAHRFSFLVAMLSLTNSDLS